MACALLINSVNVDSSGIVTVQGNLQIFTACGGQPVVTVAVTCGGNNYNTTATLQQITSTFYNFTATVQTNCACGNPVSVVVTNTCPNYTCQAAFSGTLCCCPTVSSVISSTSNCQIGNVRTVCLQHTVTVPAQCAPATFQTNFGDSSTPPPPQTFNAGTNTYTECHQYTAGNNYTATVTVTSPTGCSGSTIPINVAPCPCSQGFLATFCRLLQWIFLYAGAIWIALLGFNAACSLAATIQPSLGQTILVFGLLAALTLILIYIFCTPCLPCGWVPPFKPLGQIFLIATFILTLFSACGCTNLGLFMAIFLIASAIFFFLWYQLQCNLTICDILNAILDALYVAVIAVAVVYVIVLLMAIAFASLGLIACLVPSVLITSLGYVAAAIGIISVLKTSNNC